MLYWFFRALFIVFFKIVGRFQVIGHENIPAAGPVILAANHVSNFDPLVLGCAVQRMVHFIAKEELFHIPIVGFLMSAWGAIRVKRGGRGDREAIARSLKVLEQKQVFGIFIEGFRNKTNPDQMAKPQSGAAMLAVNSGAPVVPVALVNTNKLFQKMQVIIGPPLTLPPSPEAAPKKDHYLRISQTITTAIMNLKSNKA
ncbi:MAG: lysophospholipid acyltransferase family protein [Bacillota bacterium]|jgi:1-acyl-sn-glycerol-3-phosphate acyltransferase